MLYGSALWELYGLYGSALWECSMVARVLLEEKRQDLSKQSRKHGISLSPSGTRLPVVVIATRFWSFHSFVRKKALWTDERIRT